MKQIEYFAYTGQLEVWLASKGIDLVSAAPELEPIYEWVDNDTLRMSNHSVQSHNSIPEGGRWAVLSDYDNWYVYEASTPYGRCVVRVRKRAEAEALIRERPVTPAPALEPIYEFSEWDGHLRISNHKVDGYHAIPSGGRWAVQHNRGPWAVYEASPPLGLSRVDHVHTRAEAVALIRARPVQPTKD